jgi:membrane-bound metal-dependent hydrolase YbcI (DUF457 family)
MALSDGAYQTSMDTITHGIAGALIAKAAFGGDDMFASRPMTARRVITWSLMTGAIFPDIDTVRDFFSHNELLMITWHRSITHSFLGLPIFALLLAAITRAVCRFLKWESPAFAVLAAVYAVGILSHIFLDLVTTFGTMIWSPFAWSRPAWDLIFIVDFALTGLLLLPQFLAWAYSEPDQWKPRAIGLWLVAELVLLVVAAIAQIVGAPISAQNIVLTSLLLTVVIFLPAQKLWGTRASLATWNRIGVLAAGVYLAAAAYAHHVALERIRAFASFEQLDVEAIGALPLPPSIWHWDGLIRTPSGIYDWRMDLAEKSPIQTPFASPGPGNANTANSGNQPALKYSLYPEAPANEYIERARQLPEVQKVLWFSRFPLTRFHKEGDDAVVEILDKRFPQIRPDRPAPFTYRVRFDGNGRVVSQGWEK